MPNEYINEVALSEKTAVAPPNRLQEEYANSVFKIHLDDSISGASAVGFIAEGAKIVTTFDTIRNGGELLAEIHGKKYKIGKNMKIDDINNIVTMEFVDKPPDLPPLKLSSTPPPPGTQIGVPRFFWGKSEERGEITGNTTQAKLMQQSSLLWPTITLRFDKEELKDAASFTDRPLIETTAPFLQGGKAGPLLSGNEVHGILTDQHKEHSYAIPAQKIQELLHQKDGDNKFNVSAGFENGILKFGRDWNRDPMNQCGKTFMASATMLGLLGMKYGTNEVKLAGTALVGLNNGGQLWSDYERYSKSTNTLDTKKFGIALAADAATALGTGVFAAGLRFTALRPVGLGLVAAGLAGRLASELIPNNYVIQKIERADGSGRRPFPGARALD